MIKQIHNFKYTTGAHPEILAQFRKGKRPTEFGNKVWATSLVLIDYLAKQPYPLPFSLNNLRVLEIGCGWGLLGVFLAKNFGCAVTCTDMDAHVLPIVQLHAQLNDVSVQTMQASFNDLSTEYLRQFDVIIGTEICYSEEVGQDIMRLIQRAFGATVSYILIGDPGRPDFEDCLNFSKENYLTEVAILPGSVNGKSTQLLIIRPPLQNKR